MLVTAPLEHHATASGGNIRGSVRRLSSSFPTPMPHDTSHTLRQPSPHAAASKHGCDDSPASGHTAASTEADADADAHKLLDLELGLDVCIETSRISAPAPAHGTASGGVFLPFRKRDSAVKRLKRRLRGAAERGSARHNSCSASGKLGSPVLELEDAGASLWLPSAKRHNWMAQPVVAVSPAGTRAKSGSPTAAAMRTPPALGDGTASMASGTPPSPMEMRAGWQGGCRSLVYLLVPPVWWLCRRRRRDRRWAGVQ